MKQYVFTPNDSNVGQVLFKILKETQSGKMVWASIVVNIELGSSFERPDGLAYNSNLQGTPLRIYKLYNSQLGIWRIVLELYNPKDGTIHWRFPENNNIVRDIYIAVESKYHSLNDFFSKYLSGG